jgi:REP element-mobilizing transposase RayT
MGQQPVAYFITFSCYGKRLHGNEAPFMDRSNNVRGTPPPSPNRARQITAHRNMTDVAQTLNSGQRNAVLATIQEVSRYRNWHLYAAHVRTNHVHVVVDANGPPSIPLHDLKAYSTRRLNELQGESHKRWAAHGSTRYLWNEADVSLAVEYVANQQGRALALYTAPDLSFDPGK